MTTTTPVRDQLGLGPIGIALDVSADGQHLRDAAEAEELGYSTLWLAGGQLDRLELIADVLAATSRVSVAPGIIPVDVYSSEDVARFHRELPPDQRDRFVVGLGGPQAPRPLQALAEYLDRLDRADPPVPAHRRLLAALGPRKLELSRDRAAGAVPMLVTPEYTADARRILGAESVLAINQMVVLDSDGQRAREVARTPLRFLAQVPGYRAAFVRMGLSDNDIDELNDRLIDALVSWGDAETVAARVREHRAAGADHVVISPINAQGAPRSMDGPRQLARLLSGPATGSGAGFAPRGTVAGMTDPEKSSPSGDVHEAGEGRSDEDMRDAVAEQTDSASEHADNAGKDWDGEEQTPPEPA